LGFIDVFSLVRLNTVELIYFPTLSTVRGKDQPCHGVFTPLSLVTSWMVFASPPKKTGSNSTGATTRSQEEGTKLTGDKTR
jgi:hypothetical protein